MKISYQVLQAEALPFGYGVAYHDHAACFCVAYPVPLNHIVRFFRWLWHKLIMHNPTKLDKMLQKSYRDGVSKRRENLKKEMEYQYEKGMRHGAIIKEVKEKSNESSN